MSRWASGRVLVASAAALLACGRVGFDAVPSDVDGGAGDGDGGGSSTGDGGGGDGPTSQFNIAFVTSTLALPGDLGGVAGADSICNTLAANAGLPGLYVAWLSDAGTTAPDRLLLARGWVRVDGKPIADTAADLVAGSLLHPILLTETGQAVTAQTGVLTGTTKTGAVGQTCLGYTSSSAADQATAGIPSATRDNWTDNIDQDCDSPRRHYCFGISRSTPLAYTPAMGPRAFVTAAGWPPSGGPSGADAACQTAADAQSLGGTWRALLATTTASAASRFSATGLPWVRLDGIPLASSRSVLLDGQTLDAPLNLTETGQYRASNPAQTGATSTTALGASNTTCVDWASSSSTDTQRVGLLNSITLYFSTPIFQNCNAGGQLYCLEI